MSPGSSVRPADLGLLPHPVEGDAPVDQTKRPSQPVAIVGMGCLFPQASNPEAYWRNLLSGIYPFVDVPPSRWEIERYHDPDPAARDRTYVRLGAFLTEIPFDWKKYRMPPRLASQLNPMHVALLEVTAQAIEDAGAMSAALAARTGFVVGSIGLGLAPDQALRVRAHDYLDALARSTLVQVLDAGARARLLRD